MGTNDYFLANKGSSRHLVVFALTFLKLSTGWFQALLSFSQIIPCMFNFLWGNYWRMLVWQCFQLPIFFYFLPEIKTYFVSGNLFLCYWGDLFIWLFHYLEGAVSAWNDWQFNLLCKRQMWFKGMDLSIDAELRVSWPITLIPSTY